MAVGDRMKRIRNFRKMTMKELGMAVGFDESSADVRIAQYENNSRKPKEELLERIAQALDVSIFALRDTRAYTDVDLLHAFFDWEEGRLGVNLFTAIDDTTDPEYPRECVALSFDYSLLDVCMEEWLRRRIQLRDGEITRDEYQEWKLNWPHTSDIDIFVRHWPQKEWRKNK